ncbi:hypothetical protein OAG26_01490 [Flavobacteriales bacterium]|nr:hypothetical protein [Flavobacteriales bacterium]
MMISLFDWIWIAIIAVTTAGSIAFCLSQGRREVQSELDHLRKELNYQRTRKKFWKAKAKAHGHSAGNLSPAIPLNPRTMPLKASGSGH